MGAPVTAVVGYGPGLGAALARRFAREGHVVGAFARKPVAEAPLIALPCDVTDGASIARAFDALEKKSGPVANLLYNASALVRGPFLQTAPGDFERAWRTAAFGAFTCAQRVLPGMLAAGRGTILFTGATASLRGGANFPAFASAKFALRGLAQSLAREFGPQGVHVAHVVIDGMIGPKREDRIDPDHIAEAYWNLAAQPRSAWTQEIDLRPHGEKF
ncbi:hypothetical protein BWI17_01900 [Betaproteobacteria bacterium GR16-43]|nr:hypothetical protein BWI17_01900 [Betaproteobacteria bacterium GR16-43]